MMSKRRGRDDADSGQMILLTAIILAIALVALAGMAARIDQISDDAELAQGGQFFGEVDLVVDGVTEAMDTLAVRGDPLGNATFQDDLDDALKHLEHIERSRGIQVRFGTVSCSPTGTGAQLEMPLSIASIHDEVTLTIARDYPGASCT